MNMNADFLDAQLTAYLSLRQALGFQLGAEQTEQSLNALVTVANNANTDITSLASAMSFVAPAANAAGVSLETTAAAIGVLGDVGIDASKAGTSLRQILIQLSNISPFFQRSRRALSLPHSLGKCLRTKNSDSIGFGFKMPRYLLLEPTSVMIMPLVF